MNVLVTGGAGFIGRWVTRALLQDGHEVTVFDNLSNGSADNLSEFASSKALRFVEGDVRRKSDVEGMFDGIDTCIHLAAQINVQESIDDPEFALESNVNGTFNVLEEARKADAGVSVIGTCMVYELASGDPISERHATKPASPYAATKLAGEDLALSYYHAYGLPVTILRPFNTYGPFQKSNSEGGVVSIFVKRHLEGKSLNIYGDGTQTRDLLYVEDCARFITTASFHPDARGEVFNAGTGKDVTITELATMIAGKSGDIRYVPHIHPQSEIQRLVCDPAKAERVLGWRPEISLREGISRTSAWFEDAARQ